MFIFRIQQRWCTKLSRWTRTKRDKTWGPTNRCKICTCNYCGCFFLCLPFVSFGTCCCSCLSLHGASNINEKETLQNCVIGTVVFSNCFSCVICFGLRNLTVLKLLVKITSISIYISQNPKNIFFLHLLSSCACSSTSRSSTSSCSTLRTQLPLHPSSATTLHVSLWMSATIQHVHHCIVFGKIQSVPATPN